MALASPLAEPVSLLAERTVGLIVSFSWLLKNGSRAIISAADWLFCGVPVSKKSMVVLPSSSCSGAMALKKVRAVGVSLAGGL